MTSTPTIIDRNQTFAQSFSGQNLPPLPKLRTVIITCADARVDPAHTLGMNLGDAVVIRNNGGRVTASVIEELAATSFMVAQMDGDTPGRFEVIIVQHTQCGAERFADPNFQKTLKEHAGVDVSATAIHNHDESICQDIKRLKDAPELPNYIIASGFIYDVTDGSLREVMAPSSLSTLAI